MLRFYGTYARSVTPEGEFAAGVPLLAFGSTIIWQGGARTHDCEACAASGWSELLLTTGLLALIPVAQAATGAFEFEASSDTAARMNLVGPAPERPAPATAMPWQHDHRCAPPEITDAELVARIRASLPLAGGNCRRARIPNCELDRLLAIASPNAPDDDELADVLEGNECYLADGFAPALIGWGQRFHDTFAVYDRRRCIEILVARGMNEAEAEEFFGFNTVGSWVGPGTPAFVSVRRAS